MQNNSSSARPEPKKVLSKGYKIEENPEYKGLTCNLRVSRFEYFNCDPIYKFPVPSNSATSNIIESENCFIPQNVNTSDFYSGLHEKSPFKRGDVHNINISTLDSFEKEAPNNSINLFSPRSPINLNSFNSGLTPSTPFNLAEEMEKNRMSLNSSYNTSNSRTPPEKADISLATKEMILNIHKNFTSNQQDDFYLKSITPVSSLDLSQAQESIPSIPEILFNSSNLDMSVMEFDCKRLYNSINFRESNHTSSFIVVTEDPVPHSIEEYSAESKYQQEYSTIMFKSTEALKTTRKSEIKITDEDPLSSPDDEGCIGVLPDRLFLNGETASKAKLSGHKLDFSRKFLQNAKNSDQIPETFSIVDYPDPFSPLIKKIVFIECKENCNLINSAVACTGFGSSLSIEYSGNELDGKVLIKNTEKDLWSGLWGIETMNLVLKVHLDWVSCGFEHMAAVSSEKKVLTWGYGGSGCLGHGNTLSYKVPTIVNSIFHENIVYLECGGYHNAAINKDGEVWVWGRGDVNQLGISMSKLVKDDVGYVALRPLKLKEFSRQGVKIKSVACGEAHSLMLDSDGKVYSFGWDEDGQLGIDESGLQDSIASKSLKRVEGIPEKVIKISSGCIFSTCLTETGEIFVWGNGEQGQLGLGDSIKSTNFPTLLSSLKNEHVIDVVCGESNAICITKLGKVYAWGRGTTGMFYDAYPVGSDIISFIPRLIPNLTFIKGYLWYSKNPDQDFAKLLTEKVQKLKEIKISS